MSDGRGREAAPQGWDPEAVTPATRAEVYPFFAGGVVLGLVALIVCHAKNYLLLYGDAVAHLGIARRIVDSHYPGLAQLGGVWLPLPHVLMLPFIGNMAMWQTGFAAVPMSLVSFALSVAGVWRLGRRMMRPRWALVATAFYALNPNLLYLATTAMTEALFLCLLVWTVVAAVESVAAMRAGRVRGAGWGMVAAGLLVLGQVMTRYDGWILGAVVWCWIAWEWWRLPQRISNGNAVRRRLRVPFVVFTLLCVAGPLFWFWYNQHFEHDWLDFMRGPYSASAIERKTAPPGQHYRGWHNPGWALLFYTRTAQVDAAAWETGFGLMAAALWGLWRQWKPTSQNRDVPPQQASLLGTPDVGHPAIPQEDRIVEGGNVSKYRGLSAPASLREASGRDDRDEKKVRASGRDDGSVGVCRLVAGGIVLLWVPLPFYVYAVAYGSVPIFIPQLWPHSYYNARYGMEMLPALALYGALAAERFDVWMRGKTAGWARVGARLWQPVALMLCTANCIAMMYFIPLVLKEGMVNAKTRVPFERALAVTLDEFPASAPVMMSTTAHVGAVQTAGRTIESMVSEDDEVAWQRALGDPARHAAYVIAMEGDPVAKAVAAHPEGLQELQVICTTGQPCAKVYQSELWKDGGTR